MSISRAKALNAETCSLVESVSANICTEREEVLSYTWFPNRCYVTLSYFMQALPHKMYVAWPQSWTTLCGGKTRC